MNTIYIKNMVCNRCKLVVADILKKVGVDYRSIELGKVSLIDPVFDTQLSQLRETLQKVGFDLIDDKKSLLIQEIKKVILELVRSHAETIKVNYSSYLEEKLNKDYKYLSNLFSAMEGQTIEKYIIQQKIERVKELLVYEEMTLSEIAFEMGYSSVSHLSNQFKKVTGLTPSHFKEIGHSRRRSIDEL